jgi:hypothetical protein
MVLVVVLGAWSCMIVAAAAAPVFSSFPLLKHW